MKFNKHIIKTTSLIDNIVYMQMGLWSLKVKLKCLV